MKEIYNNTSIAFDPHFGFDISLIYRDVVIAVFQSIKLTEADINDFYLERGKYVNLAYLTAINIIDDEIIYSIKIDLPDFKKELQGVKTTAMSSSVMPNGKTIITAISGTYEKSIDFTNLF